MGNKMIQRILAISVSLTCATSASTALASDYIVRLRQPLNSQAQAKDLISKAGFSADSKIQIVNGEEGVLKIRTDGAVDANISSDVLSVSKNKMYRPAMNFKLKTAAQKTAPTDKYTGDSVMRFLDTGTPFADNGDRFQSYIFSTPPAVVTTLPYVSYGTDPLAADDYALKNINFPADNSIQANILTAVVDTGVDYNHEDLMGAMWRQPGSNGTVVGYDFAHDNALPFDNKHFDIDGCLADKDCAKGVGAEKFMVNPGHGTHCAGHIAAVFNNSKGIRGIGAGAQIMALKFFYDYGEEGAGQGDDAAAIKAIDYAIKNGVKVISASWGGRETKEIDTSTSELRQALVRAQQAGVLFIVAAGNDGINQDTDAKPVYPALYHLDNMIVVAATDINDQIADFSNYGSQTVDIAAPGVKILSTTADGGYNDVVAKYSKDGQEGEMDWDGTSMATPIVAGAAALIWSQYPNEDYHQIRDRILNNARKVPGLDGKVVTGGILDVSAALQ